MRRAALALAFCTLTVPLATRARAQAVSDADVLPQGVGGLLIQPGISYGPGALQRFGRGWRTNRESFIADFNNIDLSQVIAGDDASMISNTIGDLGTTGFEGNLRNLGFNFIAAFGVTDRLTIAAALPFAVGSYKLDAYLTPGARPAQYRVKNKELIVCPGGNFDVGDPDVLLNEVLTNEDLPPNYKFSIADLDRVLTSPCLGYKSPIDTFETQGEILHGIADRSYSGFRDLIFAAKYQFFRGRHISLAGITYLITPTGRVDDPDDLFDPSFGDGQWDWAFLGGVTVPLGDFRIGASAGYEFQFGDKLNRRISQVTFSDDLENQLARGEISEEQLLREHLDDGSLVPIVTSFDKADVERKLGDNFYVYSDFSYQILEWLSVGVSVNFIHHFRDRVDSIGPRPAPAEPYETEAQARAAVAAGIADGTIAPEDELKELRAHLGNTDARRRASFGWHTVRGNLVAGLGVNFNFLNMFLRDEFPIPLMLSISMSRFIAGQNLDTPDAIQATLILPFPPIGEPTDPNDYAFDGEEGEHIPYP